MKLLIKQAHVQINEADARALLNALNKEEKEIQCRFGKNVDSDQRRVLEFCKLLRGAFQSGVNGVHYVNQD